MAKETRQRILQTARVMFNTLGESKVTTNHIAEELEISPGNLYYHFRNKDDIIEHLFMSFDARMTEARELPKDRLADLEDIWFQLHMVFECIWDFRFIYRDLVEILSRNPILRARFARTLDRVDKSARRVLQGLFQSGKIRASIDEFDAAITNILVVTTFWMNYAAVRGETDEQLSIRKGIVQVMMQLAPFLHDDERSHLHVLTRDYLNMPTVGSNRAHGVT